MADDPKPLDQITLGQLSYRRQNTGRSVRKRGAIYKRGDGPINYSWNERYLVVDGTILMYYYGKED